MTSFWSQRSQRRTVRIFGPLILLLLLLIFRSGWAILLVFPFLLHRDSIPNLARGEKGRHLLMSLTTIVGSRRGRTLEKDIQFMFFCKNQIHLKCQSCVLIGAGDSSMSPFSFLSFPPPGGTLTKELVPNSLYQPGHKYSQHKVNDAKNLPITMLLRSRSSIMICATPINTFFPSTLPQSPEYLS